MSAVPQLLLLDGGAGRELARMGAPFRQPEWSALALLEGPDFVQDMHARFIASGADIVTTNSYAVVPFHLGEDRFAARGLELAALAGRLARQAAANAARPVAVAGSLPPIGGSYRADLFDAAKAREVLKVLVQGLSPHVDQWQAETLSLIAEAEVVRSVLGDDPRPLFLSFTLKDDQPDLAHPALRGGESVAAATQAAVRLGATAILFNCSRPEVMEGAVQAASDTLKDVNAPLAIGVYANAFPPQSEAAEANATLCDIRQDLTPQGYLAFAKSWRARGATIIGGCCGIGPEHIAALRAAL